uniref:MFS domain-containing protein n=1 Tax=Parastrongyloides trichosuri TaxID=131310 RepID=A0A0N4Z336_PARTI
MSSPIPPKPDIVLQKLGLWSYHQLIISSMGAFIWGLTTFAMLIPSFVQNEIVCKDCNPRLSNYTKMKDTYHLSDNELSWYSITFYIGCMAGGVTIAYISDIYGRKPISLGSLFIVGLSGMLTAWMPNYGLVLALRVIEGIFYPAAGVCMWILVMESVSFNNHTLVGLMFNIAWSIGYCFVPFIAYFYPSWNTLSIILSAPLILISIITYFLIPESFYFLLKSGNSIGLRNFIGGRVNVNIDGMIEESKSIELSEGIMKALKYICKHKKYILYSFLTSFIWSTQFLLYLTFSISSSTLSGNPYWNFVFTGLAELPAVLLGPFIMNRFHRKKPMIVCAFAVSVFCICLIFIPENYTATYLVFWMACKLLLAFTYCCIYVYFPEIFSTEIRNTAIGLCQTIANIGGILNTLIRTWIPKNSNLMILFTVISTINALLLFLLPESNEEDIINEESEIENSSLQT